MNTTTDTPNTWTIWIRQAKCRPWRAFGTAATEDEAWRLALRDVPPRHDRLIRPSASGDPNASRRPR